MSKGHPSSESKFNTFIEITRALNNELNLVPLLYGSLGLSRVVDQDFNAADVDMLIDPYFLTTAWQQLHDLMQSLEFALVDMHEHEFLRANTKAAFADITSLPSFAGIDHTALAVTVHKAVRFKELTAEQYLAVYTASQKDGYRQEKRGKSDAHKIEVIQVYLKNR